MKYLSSIDYGIIVIYFFCLVGLGFYLKKRASASLEDYFLGGRKLPWWLLGFSGMAAMVNISGTMIIISFLYMLGPRGLYIELRGGVVIVLVFAMIWGGKWHRRSGCMTNAEWMIFRFGSGLGARFARLMTVFSVVVTSIGILSLIAKGLGIFLATFLPFTPFVCSLIFVGIVTFYTMISGFYGVVFTDIFQSVLIFLAAVIVALMAMDKIPDLQSFAALAHKITGNHHWTSSIPHWKTTLLPGYQVYQYLLTFAAFYLLQNILGGITCGGDPKFFGAKNERECGPLTALWILLMTFRWPLMMAFAVFGIYLVNDFKDGKCHH